MDKKQVSVDHLERLANLTIKPAEKKKIEKQLEETVDYFRVLDQIKDLDQEEPTFQVTANTNVVAEDKTSPCLKKDLILPRTKKYFSSRQ